ncbi:MAG: segregation/condensation protein A [Candidatus Harrisonbacteria bacterium]|nr:segregation/condensation protein A [Candidatus Harrisonbacteria bacterium]
MEYEIKLDKFAGPLEKLLELIEAKQLDITLVSLAKVTGDFLDYLKNLEEGVRHPSVLADFVVVASRLLLIKSKALLPALELTEEEETDIRDLEARLKIYKEFEEASLEINNLWNKKMSLYGRELFMNLPVVFYPSENLTIERLESELMELMQELKALIPEKQTVRKVILTVEMKVKELLERLKERTEHSFKDLSKEKSKLEIILLFLAILHLIRDRIAKAHQEEKFSDILIKKHEEENLPPPVQEIP